MPAETTAVDLLDICIDALMRGEDWRACLDGSAPDGIENLMLVAESIRDSASETPPPGPRERFRAWKRIFRGREAIEGQQAWPVQDGLLQFRRFTGPAWRRPLARKSGAALAPNQPLPAWRWL